MDTNTRERKLSARRQLAKRECAVDREPEDLGSRLASAAVWPGAQPFLQDALIVLCEGEEAGLGGEGGDPFYFNILVFHKQTPEEFKRTLKDRGSHIV